MTFEIFWRAVGYFLVHNKASNMRCFGVWIERLGLNVQQIYISIHKFKECVSNCVCLGPQTGETGSTRGKSSLSAATQKALERKRGVMM